MCRLANFFLFPILISFGIGILQEQHQTDRRRNTTVLSYQRVEVIFELQNNCSSARECRSRAPVQPLLARRGTCVAASSVDPTQVMYKNLSRWQPVRRCTGSGHPRQGITRAGTRGHNFSHPDLPRPAAVIPKLPIWSYFIIKLLPNCFVRLIHLATCIITRQAPLPTPPPPLSALPRCAEALTSHLLYCRAGDLFDMLLPMLSIYQEYVRNHHYSLQVLAECKQNPHFSAFLNRLENKPNLQGRTLETFLTYPMHQVC